VKMLLGLALALLALPVLGAPVDPRSLEVLRLDCANELGRREVTLFGNGTVRLRDGAPGKELMGLAELNPDEMQGAVNRLKGEDLSEAKRLPKGVEGVWVEKCMLALQLPDQPLQVFHFGRYDTLPLGLSRVLQVAQDLAAKVPDVHGSEQLPHDYEPKEWDVLKRIDGNRYRIVGFTWDGQGVELLGIEQPITLFVRKDALRNEFVAVLSRGR
jgi:hypothetical protein